ncbi:MAG TPA: alpha/beta fold hydrolase [Gammaproteobacteria bacterium]|nr:alpha/beta fold hydrolase [Gammaproteobacteria bacterium]
MPCNVSRPPLSRLLLCLLALYLGAATLPAAAATPAGECVVLLHGLGRTSSSMESLEEALREAGYRTANIDYPSRKADIEALAQQVVPAGLRQCREQGARRIHFVTHSLGGILIRFYLSRQQLPELGRVVMLSPPNRGSEVADELHDNPLYRWINGPAGQQLGTGPDALPNRLGPVDYPVGVITGDKGEIWDHWFSGMIPGKDDGKVSIARARLEGMRDFLVVHRSHTYIMKAPEVIQQVLHFLREGRFCHGDGCGESSR